MGVTSLMAEISSPATCSERIAASRPEPGPFTQTSTRLRPMLMASRAVASAATCAANGVLLREPLKPAFPALAQLITFPSVSVIVMMVLLKLACTWATPLVPTLRSRFLPFLTSATLVLLAGRARPAGSAVHPGAFGAGSAVLRPGASGAGSAVLRPGASGAGSALLAGFHFLAAHGHLLRTLPRARVCLGALSMHRETAALPQPPVSADVHEALDVHGVLAAQRALHLVLALDQRPQLARVLVGECLDARVGTDARLLQQPLRRGRADAEDVRER